MRSPRNILQWKAALAGCKGRFVFLVERSGYDFPDDSLGISFFIAASPSAVTGAGGNFAAVPEPPLPEPKNFIAVAARPSSAPPPFPPPVTSTSGTNFALPSASAATTLTIAVALEPNAW